MKTIDLEFEDYPGDVYTVVVSPIPLPTFERLDDLYAAAGKQFQQSGGVPEIRALLGEFVKVAKPTLNGKAAKLLDADPNLIFALIQQWHAGVRSVPLPLLRRSGSTGPSPE